MDHGVWRSRSARRILLYPIITLIVGVTLALSTNWTFHRHLSWRVSDLIVQYFALRKAHDRIVIVGIDSASLNDETGYGQRLTEWDRTIYAELLTHLHRAGARVVVFDILFAGADEHGDPAFAAALRQFPSTVLNVVQNDGVFQKPVATLREAGPRLGHANVMADSDHVVRRAPLLRTAQGEQHEALGLQALRLFWRLPPDVPLQTTDGRAWIPNGLNVPLDDQQHLVINYAPPNSYILPHCGISTLLAHRDAAETPCPEELFDGKIVFVGATALAARDIHSTPVGFMYGVEIHANIAATLLENAALQEQSLASRRLVIIGLALLLGVLGTLRKPTVLVVAIAGGGIVLLALAAAAYHGFLLRMDVAGPLLTLFCAGIAVLAVQNATQRREQREIITLLTMQISRNVSRQLLEAYDRNELVLGGELRTVTIVFIDMRNYTALAETLPPQNVMYVINTYLEIIADELIRYDGTLSQYVGDQAMAIFNAPTDQADHPLHAIDAAVAALKAVDAFNRTQRSLAQNGDSKPDIPVLATFGAGINTGEAVAGNIGTNDRYNYTVIGDTVNVAARLCSAAPAGTIYIGPDTLAAHPLIQQRYPDLETVGPLRVKGKADPLTVYSLRPCTQTPELA